MKKLFLVFALIALFLTSCEDEAVSKIGGADGPTAIIVGEEKGEDRFIKSWSAKDSESGWSYDEWDYHVELRIKDMPYDNSGVLAIPSEIDGKPVTHITEHNFDSQSWNVETLIIPDSVKYIGDDAFRDLKPANNITIPDTLLEVGDNVFSRTGWYDLQTEEFCIVGDGILVKYNGTSNDIVIPEGVKFVADAFEDIEVHSVAFSSTVEKIGNSAFYGEYTLKSVTIPGNVKVIGKSAFGNCSLKELTLEEGVEVIRNYAFSDNKLTAVVLPESFDDLWGFAFNKNYDLDSVTVLGNPTYFNTDGLENVRILIPEGSPLAEKINTYEYIK